MVGTHLDVVQGATGREIPYLQGSNPVKGEEITDPSLVPAVAGEHAVARTLTLVHPGGLPAQGWGLG